MGEDEKTNLLLQNCLGLIDFHSIKLTCNIQMDLVAQIIAFWLINGNKFKNKTGNTSNFIIYRK